MIEILPKYFNSNSEVFSDAAGTYSSDCQELSCDSWIEITSYLTRCPAVAWLARCRRSALPAENEEDICAHGSAEKKGPEYAKEPIEAEGACQMRHDEGRAPQ